MSFSHLNKMGTEGLEPSRTITRQRILSPSCLPIPPRPQRVSKDYITPSVYNQGL
jgi:hypothetical protein